MTEPDPEWSKGILQNLRESLERTLQCAGELTLAKRTTLGDKAMKITCEAMAG